MPPLTLIVSVSRLSAYLGRGGGYIGHVRKAEYSPGVVQSFQEMTDIRSRIAGKVNQRTALVRRCVGGLRHGEHVCKDRGVLCEQARVNPESLVFGDEDDVAVVVPKIRAGDDLAICTSCV